MKRDHSKVNLIMGENGQFVEGNLFEGISDKNLRDYQEKWIPILNAVRQRYITESREGRMAPRVEDAHWDWSRKIDLNRSSLSHRHFAVEGENLTQALMQLELALHHSRIESGKHLVYLDFISVAPWNRKQLFEIPRFQGIGSILLAQSIGTSFDEGFLGRVGLHSLPRAAGWYRKLDFVSFGPDEGYQNLEYFEMSKEDAAHFIQQMDE